MSLHNAMLDACKAVGIKPPKHTRQGRWCVTDTDGKNGKGDGRVKIDDDGKGGVAWNHQTGQHVRFRETGPDGAPIPIVRDYAAERARLEEEAEIAATCERIVRACRVERHPYLARKGFPDEEGLVIDSITSCLPKGKLGEDVAFRLPKEAPFLIVPGRVGRKITTVQFITPSGDKKNIYRGIMSGACHRIATGHETWVCEGIATALSVRAALRLLGRQATVLCAFAAHNAEKVATATGGIIAADHDKPVDTFGGLGTGEYYARRSGLPWVMPPTPGDFNDMHVSEGLRAVAMRLRGVMSG